MGPPFEGMGAEFMALVVHGTAGRTDIRAAEQRQLADIVGSYLLLRRARCDNRKTAVDQSDRARLEQDMHRRRGDHAVTVVA